MRPGTTRAETPPPAPQARRGRFALWVAGAVLLLVATWSNHFGNAFHFDDSHTVVDNPAIRSLASVPRFFTDARTFSVLPLNQSWRPLVSTSLALDYWMGGGLRPTWFHVSTFTCYLLTLACTYFLFLTLMQRPGLAPHASLEPARPDPQKPLVALYATTLFAVHPACAETVNYIVQRADLYVAWALVASVFLFARGGRSRQWGLYLIPVVLGALAKPSALVLPFLVALYLWIYERPSWRGLARGCAPSLAVAALLGLVHACMVPPTYVTGAAAKAPYLWTQPLVALHFARTFFLPTALSADTDWSVLPSPFTLAGLAGLAFVVLVCVVTVRCAALSDLRPVAFGLGWFVLTMLPTSLTPLAEVTNDHRMFAPFVGLALAVTWAGHRILQRLQGSLPRRTLQGLALFVLLIFSWGTHVRNEVWRTEESLWADVVQKSPTNGRGWMNYGLAVMGRGQFQEALRCFQQGLQFAPGYSVLHTNMGVVLGAMGRNDEARQHFEQALDLSPRTASACGFYGRWLMGRGDFDRAISVLEEGLHRSPDDPLCAGLLLEALLKGRHWARLEKVIAARRLPPQTLDETTLARYEAALKTDSRSAVEHAERASVDHRTPETLLELSFVLHRAGEYERSMDAARAALRLRPRYAEAFNNIAADCLELARWDEAIAASRQALAIQPDLALARNNLSYAERMKRAGAR